MEEGLNNRRVRIFGVGYESQYRGCEITLGKHIDKYKWFDLGNFKPGEYLKDGWLKGVEDYLNLQSD